MTFYQNSQAILACYDLSDKGSFDSMKGWLKEAKKFSDKSSVMYAFPRYYSLTLHSACVGTKNDMNASRAVKYAEASEFAESEKVPYFECTSKEGSSVEDMFRAVGEQLAKNIKEGILEVSG
jgi:Ras-related protein Rab-1A